MGNLQDDYGVFHTNYTNLTCFTNLIYSLKPVQKKQLQGITANTIWVYKWYTKLAKYLSSSDDGITLRVT